MSEEQTSHSRRLTRRSILLGGAGAAAVLAQGARATTWSGKRPRVAVIGAGAFGGWTALSLLRRGVQTTLFDAWGPGNSRSSSGGETRVIRGMYGADRIYTEWVVRSFALWQAAEELWRAQVYHSTGALWMFRGDDAYARAAQPLMTELGLTVERPSLREAQKRWPQIDFSGVAHLHFEPQAGYLLAREACRRVAETFVAEGGVLRQEQVLPGAVKSGRMNEIVTNGGPETFDFLVFACGPWLGKLFPALAEMLAPTRQEVFFFGPPAGNQGFAESRLPIWIDFGERIFYGIPGNQHRGFKIADDSHGDLIDPTSFDRLPRPEALERARAFIGRRFPALAGAPLLETRVCQYTNTADGHFLIDRHPEAENVWLVGGGSGHGFKLGPALGEQVAGWVLREGSPPERFHVRGPARSGGASQLRGGGKS